MDKLTKFLMRPYISLVFALFCGANHYAAVLKFIFKYTAKGGGLLAFFFLPAIVAGGGFIVLKTMKSWQEQEMYKRMNILVLLHFLLFIMNIVLICAGF